MLKIGPGEGRVVVRDEEKWDATRKVFSGKSRLVKDDQYEVRLLTGSKGLKAVRVEVSPEDRAAGVKAGVAQDGDLVRIKIISPASRTVVWKVAF